MRVRDVLTTHIKKAAVIAAMLAAGSIWAFWDRQSPSNGAAEPPAYTLAEGMPIMSKPVEFTFLTGKSATSASNWDEVLLWQRYAAMTNIRVHFKLVPFENLGQERKLALATGQYPDAFYAARLSSAELMKYGKEGVLVKLNRLIDEYAPHIKRLLDRYPELRASLTMPDGGIYSIPSYYDPEFTAMLIGTPLWINEGWLKKLGMNELRTTDDLYAYLKAVKNNDPNGNGVHDEIAFGSLGINTLVHQLKGAWGLGNRGLAHPLVDIDEKTGSLRFIPTDPKFKETLQFIHKLYAEGLIESSIFTIGSSEFYAKGSQGVYGSMIMPSPYTLMKQTGYVGAPALEGPHGDRLYSHVKAPLVHVGAFAITNKSRTPEALMRWIDYFFSEEGSKMFFMGIKDVSYEETDGGDLRFTQGIMDHADGLTMEQALTPYVTWLGGSYPGFVRQSYFRGSESFPESVQAAQKVKPYAVKQIWPPFNVSFGSLGTEISAYVNDMQAKFITGEVPFSDWDKYVGNLGMIGLKPYMDIYNEAYRAYINEN